MKTKDFPKRLLGSLVPDRMKRCFQEKLFSSLRLNWRLNSGIELEVLSTTDWSLLNDIFVEGEYDGAIQLLVGRIKANGAGVVVNLGANVGFFELRLFQLLHRTGLSPGQVKVYSFEPDEENIQEFHRRVSKAGPWHATVTAVRALVGQQKSGQATYWKSHNHHSCTAKAGRKYAGAWEVSADYVDVESAVPCGPVDLLKCDIEGAEWDFVQGYPELLKRTTAGVFEIHDPREVDKIREALRQVGLSHEQIVADRSTNSVHLFSRP